MTTSNFVQISWATWAVGLGILGGSLALAGLSLAFVYERDLSAAAMTAIGALGGATMFVTFILEQRISETLPLRLTHRLWNRQISRILCQAYSERVINSEQLHELLAKFDPTQKHEVY